MRYLKMLGLAAVAAAALMAFVGAGTAFAGPTELFSEHTTLEGTDKNPKNPATIHVSLKPGTSAVLTDTSEGITDTCEESTVHGDLTNTTSENEVEGKVLALTWGKCTWATNTLELGEIDITHIGDVNADGVGDGTVTGTANLVTVKAFNLVSCLYGTAGGTHLGVLTGATEGHATMDVNAVINEQEPKKALCPDTTFWKATYTVTSPKGLNVGE